MPKPPAIKSLNLGEEHIRFLVYGEPGVGKTLLATSSPKCLVLKADPNIVSAAMAHRKVDVWDIEDWQDMDEAGEYLLHSAAADGYEWVWLDSVTHFQERGLDSIMRDIALARSNRLVWAADKGEYGQNMMRLNQWMRWNVVPAKVNFGVTAHELKYEVPSTDKVIIMPYVQGKEMPEKFSSYMNIVGRLTAVIKDDQVERRLTTRKSSSAYGKDNFLGALGGVMLAPTVPKITAAITSKLEAARASRVPPTKAAPVKSAAKKTLAPRKAS